MASDLVEGATSEVLYGPDWGLNIELCDIVNDDPRLAKDVLKAVKKRLGNKNPKVQTLALVVIETLIKNSGDNIHLQVVERGILNEMVKIVKKKPDKETQEKILALLNEWKESFGGPQGKFPQFYEAYHELVPSVTTDEIDKAVHKMIIEAGAYPSPLGYGRFPKSVCTSVNECLCHGIPDSRPLQRAGVKFPQNLDSTSVALENQDTQPSPLNAQSSTSPDYGTKFAQASTDSNLSGLNLVDIEKARSTMEVLTEMLNVLDPCNKEGVKDEIIMDLVEQCSFNQQRTMQLVVTTSDEQLLFQGLALNDELQQVLAKHDAIASGSYNPSETVPVPSLPLVNIDQEEEAAEDREGQLFRRSSRVRTQSEGEVSIRMRKQPTTEPSPSGLEVNIPLSEAVQNLDLLNYDAYKSPPLETLQEVNPGKFRQPSPVFQKAAPNKELMSHRITSREQRSSQMQDETKIQSNGKITSSVIPTTQSNGNQKKMRNHGKAMHSVQGNERKMNAPEAQQIDPISDSLQVQNNKVTSNLQSPQVENSHKGPQIHDKVAMPAIPPPPSKYTERQKFFQLQRALASGQVDGAYSADANNNF